MIKGISISNYVVKSLMYADDTTIFLDGSFSGLQETVNTFEVFERSSGLKVNIEKSSLFPLGSLTRAISGFPHIFGLKWTVGPTTLLGITFTNNRDDLFELNYTPKLSRLKQLLGIWSQRDLSLIGKVTIVKTLGL